MLFMESFPALIHYCSKVQGTLFLLIFSVQVDDTEVISFLLSTEIIPLCLRTMEMGSELSKTVSASSMTVSDHILPC